MNQTIKVGLRRFLEAVPDSMWWEFVPEVARACRCFAHPATKFSPHFLVFKCEPELPLPAHVRAVTAIDFAKTGETAI